jgi:hypothetical protein
MEVLGNELVQRSDGRWEWGAKNIADPENICCAEKPLVARKPS